MARYHPPVGVMTKPLTILTFVVGAAALSMLAILQIWQGKEREKIDIIIGNLSSLTQTFCGTKPVNLGNVERYVLLCFMCRAFLVSGFLTRCRLMLWLSY